MCGKETARLCQPFFFQKIKEEGLAFFYFAGSYHKDQNGAQL